MDAKDQAIIKLLSEDPDLTITRIAEQVQLSQPAIGARVKVLRREKGLLQKIYGINFKNAGLSLIRVDLQIKNFTELIHELETQPNILNIFTLTGTYNLSIYIFGRTLEEINVFIDDYIRVHSEITKMKINVINKVIPQPILPNIFTAYKKKPKYIPCIGVDHPKKEGNDTYPLPQFQRAILQLLRTHEEAHLNKIRSHLQDLVDSRQIHYNYRVSEQKTKTHLECLEELGLIELFKLGSTKFVRLKH